MKIELDLSDPDYEIIKKAKEESQHLGNLELATIGDIVLSNIKL
jgi:hypothetical protein